MARGDYNRQATRNAQIYALHLEGWSYTPLAARFGLTRQRIGQIIQRERANPDLTRSNIAVSIQPCK